MRELLDERNSAGHSVVAVVARHYETKGRHAVKALLAEDPATAARLAVGLARIKTLLRAEASPEHPAKAKLSIRRALARDLTRLVKEHFEQHGREVLDDFLKASPSRYVRFVADVLCFTMLGDNRAPVKQADKRRKAARPLRMSQLKRAVYDGPIDVNSPLLPERWRNRWLAELESLTAQGLSPSDLTPQELRALWPKRLAAWYERQVRRRRGQAPEGNADTAGLWERSLV